jgi:sec-independent protein translocase protein TatA
MFGLGFGEVLLILVIALIFIGPKKLPEVAKGLGQGLRELQKASKALTDQIAQEADAVKREVDAVSEEMPKIVEDDPYHVKGEEFVEYKDEETPDSDSTTQKPNKPV